MSRDPTRLAAVSVAAPRTRQLQVNVSVVSRAPHGFTYLGLRGTSNLAPRRQQGRADGRRGGVNSCPGLEGDPDTGHRHAEPPQPTTRVRPDCGAAVRRLHHPVVGPLDLSLELLSLPDDAGQRVAVYNAAPGSPSAGALRRLAVS